MENINTGGSEVNIKKERYDPVETDNIDVEHNNDYISLEKPKSEILVELAGINDTVIDCDIGNNQQSISISDHEINNQMSERSKTWYKCRSCSYKTKYKSCLKSHVHLKDDDKPVRYQCCFCSRKTKSKQNLLVHFRTQHDTDPVWYQCYHCGFKSKYKHWLSEHIKIIHSQDHMCREGIEWFHCDSCEFKSTSQWYLEFHLKYTHSPTDDVDHCEGATVSSLHSNQNDTKDVQCTNKCEFKIDITSDACDSDVHKEMIHHIEVKPDLALNMNESDAQSDHQLDNCDSTIDLISNSCENDTQYGHTDGRDFKHDPLHSSSENMNHSVVGIEQQPYVTSNFHEDLIIRQERSHPLLGEEPKSFVCSVCGYKTLEETNLRDHLELHHSKSSNCYHCQFCNFKSKHEDNVKDHVEKRHNQNYVRQEVVGWFHCNMCAFKSTSLWYLEFHWKYSHKRTDELDQYKLKTGETIELSLDSDSNDAEKEDYIDECEFKID